MRAGERPDFDETSTSSVESLGRAAVPMRAQVGHLALPVLGRGVGACEEVVLSVPQRPPDII
jgi:hypothetical protein